MPTYFPAINSNLIITQLPYTTSQAYESVIQDVESGMRFTFPRRAAGLTGYPTTPMMQFQVSFPMITDAEVVQLQSFFRSMRGQWGSFRFLDPGGNLLQYSEDFSQAYWAKSGSFSAGAADPFGHSLGWSANGTLSAVVGPSDGGMSGFVMCASLWVKSASAQTVTIGFGFSSSSFLLPAGAWLRIHNTAVIPDNSQVQVSFSCSGSVSIFGFQVSPSKGEAAYSQSPSNYGYHANCRFATDTFTRNCVGPNQNQVALPVQEFFV